MAAFNEKAPEIPALHSTSIMEEYGKEPAEK